jgi:hypothetical protein
MKVRCAFRQNGFVTTMLPRGIIVFVKICKQKIQYVWKPRHHKKAALALLNYMALATRGDTNLLLHAPMQEKMSEDATTVALATKHKQHRILIRESRQLKRTFGHLQPTQSVLTDTES